MTTPVRVPGPIREPYTALLTAVRERCSAEIERMEQARGGASSPADRQAATEEWEECSPGLIVVDVEWPRARNVMGWAADDEHPTVAPGSPEYVVDLTDLEHAARAAERPRQYFESHVVFALQIAQDHLIDYFRDGPTDDIPYERHLVFVRGTEFADGTRGVTDFVVARERYDD